MTIHKTGSFPIRQHERFKYEVGQSIEVGERLAFVTSIDRVKLVVTYELENAAKTEKVTGE